MVFVQMRKNPVFTKHLSGYVLIKEKAARALRILFVAASEAEPERLFQCRAKRSRSKQVRFTLG
jgi:hypothetical protein